ncbi:MAG TPA: hypothetical protein VGG57_12360 [Stellaceae bacterium]|jgi:antitoxin HicB
MRYAYPYDLSPQSGGGYTDHSEPLPRPSPAHGRPIALLPPLVAAKLALYDARLAEGVCNVDLARRLGTDEKAIRRLRDPLHQSRIAQSDAALRLLGRRIGIVVEAA